MENKTLEERTKELESEATKLLATNKQFTQALQSNINRLAEINGALKLLEELKTTDKCQ